MNNSCNSELERSLQLFRLKQKNLNTNMGQVSSNISESESKIERDESKSMNSENDSNQPGKTTVAPSQISQPGKVEHDKNNKDKNIETKRNCDQVLHSIINKHTEFEDDSPIDLNQVLKPLSSSQDLLPMLKKFIHKRRMTYDKDNDTITINCNSFEYKYKLKTLVKSRNSNSFQSSWVVCGICMCNEK